MPWTISIAQPTRGTIPLYLMFSSILRQGNNTLADSTTDESDKSQNTNTYTLHKVWDPVLAQPGNISQDRIHVDIHRKLR
jgi:hypothetical protein